MFKFDNNTPIYIQLVEQLKIDIISGQLKSGERLPSVRDLALQNKVNPNTMQKALVELEELNLIYTERTNGKYVTEDTKLIEKHKNDPNSIFITGGNGDGGIGIVVENRVSGDRARIAEGPLKIETPLEVIKKAISIGDGFTEKMRPPLGLKARIKEILNML